MGYARDDMARVALGAMRSAAAKRWDMQAIVRAGQSAIVAAQARLIYDAQFAGAK